LQHGVSGGGAEQSATSGTGLVSPKQA